MDLFYYLFFSTIEGIGVFYLTLTLFRYKLKEYLFPIIVINILISFLTYNLQQDDSISWVTPITQLTLLAFFIQILLRIPIVWSGIIAITGIVAFGLIQTIFLYALVSLDVLTIERIQNVASWESYVLQTLEAMLIYPLSYFLYRKGLGFSFDFGKFSLQKEKIWVTVLIILSFTGFTLIFLMKNMLIATIIFSLCLIFLLQYHLRKEREF